MKRKNNTEMYIVVLISMLLGNGVLFVKANNVQKANWKVSKITTPDINTALALIWDDHSQSLYFISFVAYLTGSQASMFRYSFQDGIFYSAYAEGIDSPGFILPIKRECKKCKCDQQLFAVGSGNQVYMVKWNGKSTKAKVIRPIFGVDIDNAVNKWSIGKSDGRGRFYGGTISRQFCNATPTYSVYRYGETKRLDRLFTGTVSTTGFVFNEKAHKMYHVDTCASLITEFDYDVETGDICNSRVVYDFALNNNQLSTPHGLEIDEFGMLYTAMYTEEIWKINPWTSQVVDIFRIPVPGASGVAFGGPNRDILFVLTQAGIYNGVTNQFVRNVDDGSSLYMITGLGLRGMPYPVRMNIKKKAKSQWQMPLI